MNLREYVKNIYEQLICLKGEPRKIACGLAIGVFIGVTPTIPFHTIFIVSICFIFKQNITAGYLGSWLVSNPLTIPFFYFFQYRLGKYLLGRSYTGFVISDYSMITIIQKGWSVVLPLLTGGLIMAPFFAIPAYFIAHKLLLTIWKKRNEYSKEHP